MDTLYKYSGLLPIKYFDNPTLKISVVEHLNDPFEFIHSKDINKAVGLELKKYFKKNEELEVMVDTFVGGIKSFIQQNGIISLSETPRNLLMWAHYADNHKGMCIGYKKNVLEEKSSELKKDRFEIAVLSPKKINYDNYRFPIEDYLFPDNMSANEIEKQFVMRHFFTKSDEWIYEKEFRFILPYTLSTSFLMRNEDSICNKIYSPDGIASDGGGIKFSEIKPVLLHKKCIENTEDEYIYKINHKYMNKGYFSFINSYQDLSLLTNINIDSIDSVYLGCKVDKGYIKDLYKKLKEIRKEKSPIKVYLSTVSPTRFELEQKVLTDEMVSKM
ncbi:DUF2971 domain-containing protein [Aeromonas hydrophila]|nr:DUF2971 domain-containing protein [Aeromonas hydrophila]